ncbi:MAG: bkdA1 [Frankiales bacterium]|nr:bkdA1 [Frankiales bacterium]
MTKALSPLEIYRLVLASRLSEQRITELSKAGELPGHHSGLNHESVGIAVGSSVDFDDCVQTSYRSGAAVMHARGGLTLRELILQGFGLLPGIRAQHPGGARILRSTGILGGQVPTAVGVALSYQLRRKPNVVISVFGDGASNEGAIHECMNIAGVKRLPLIFVVENNGIALSTRGSDSTAAKTLADRGAGYGIPAVTVDGGDAMATYAAMTAAVARTRSGGGPQIIEMKLTRPGEHASVIPDVRSEQEVSDARLVDAVANLRNTLINSGTWDAESDASLIKEFTEIVDAAVDEARQRKANLKPPTDDGLLPEAQVWRMAHASDVPAALQGASR